MLGFLKSLFDFFGSVVGKDDTPSPIITPKVPTPVIPPVNTPVTSATPVSEKPKPVVEQLPQVILHRKSTGTEGTPGTLIVSGHSFSCDTLELMWDNNKNDTSCIPAGKYKCIVTYSPNMKKDLYELQNVPNRHYIRIHSGNFAGQKSKGYKSDILGCILVGGSMGEINGQDAILDSKITLAKFMEVMQNKPFELTIINNFSS